MADSRAVKSLNKSEGRKRYVFKKLDKRMAEIEINVLQVFRSLDKVKDKPSQGSTYLKDCLVEFRELNTAADFILFYEEMLPFVQTLPLVLLHQDLIFSKLVSSLHMKARFSLEPFLRLISALSRDLLDGFLPFLPRVVNSIVTLLRNGGQNDSDILEQIFVSWSYIVRDLQKYLICDIESILRDTLELRYYPGEYINKLMSPSISFLLRTARDEQLKIGIKRILSEVAADPLKIRGGVSLVIYHVMRGTSVHLHSKAGQVLRFLLKDSTLSFCDHFPQGSGSILVEALSSTLQRICKDVKAEELCVMWKCLYEETTETIKNKETAHLSRLLTLLTSIVRVEKGLKVYDFPYLVGLVSQIVPTFLDSSDVLDKVLGLMLCTIDRPSAADEMESIANQWAPIFSFKCSSSLLLSFLWELLRKEDKLILKAFTSNILSWINNMILVSPEEVFPLLLSLCESHDKAKMRDEPFENKFERIHEFLEGKIKKIQRNIGLAQIEEAELAAAWGAVECFPYFKVDSSLLICFKNTLIQHLAASVVNTTSSAPELMWQSLLGAALRSCHKFCSSGRINHLRPCHKSRSTGRLIHSDLEEALSLAKSYKSCVQVLSPVADYLDVVYRSLLAKNDISKACPELLANNAEDAFDIFSENLCHSKKDVRLMTLRILCHFETLYPNPCFEEHPPPMKKLKTQVIQNSFPESNNVLELLKSVEESHLTLSTETKLVRDITTMKTDLSAGRIHEAYVPLVYKGMIGLFHNQFPKIWEPVSECLAVLMKKHTGAVWNDFVHYLDQCQLKLEALDNHHSENENYSISHKHTGLIERFNSFVLGPSGRTQPTEKGKVVSLLLKTLQKVPDVAQSRASDLLPLLMKFLGYNSENPLRVGLYNGGACKGEEWKGLLIQWLTLLKLMKNPRSCCFSQFVNDVLQNRFLDHYDAEIQMSVLECLVLWNDYLIPHRHRLENLIKPKELREELATWNFSKDIEEAHRCHFVSLVIRILMPKVRNLKNSASRKHTSISHRKAVLGVISQLDVDELALFFALLMKPLNIISEEATDLFWSSGKSSLDYFQKSNFLKSINADTISTLSWKKKSGFLHVIQHILEVFDVFHVQPFLDFLMGCVVRLLTTYDPNIDVEKSVATNHDQAGTCLKQFKDMRSLCLKIIARVLEKYEDCDLGSEFWDLFLSAVNSLIKSFKQEGSSSEKPSSLFSCFLSMSKSRSLVTLLCRQESLVPDIFSILTVTTASEAIKSSALSFIENLLSLESDLDDDDGHMIKGFLDPYVEALINSLHSLFHGDILKRKSFKYHGEREIKILKLLSKHIRDESTVMEYLDILLSFLDKRVKDSEIHREALLAIQDMTWLLGSESSSKIIVRVSPLLVDAELDVRLCICHLLESLSKIDISLDLMAKCVSHMNATSPMEVDDLDYETIRKAYGKIDADFFAKSSEQHIMIILSQSLYNLSSSEVTLKDCAFNLLCTFIEFSASILCQEASAHSDTGKEVSKSDASCIGDRVLWIINKFILKHIGDALNRGISSGKEEILLIRKMVTKLPDSGNLAAFRPLCSENDDVDFFKNVFSIQIHRRRKAIKSFAKEMRDSSLPEGVVRKLLVSVFFNMLLDGQEKNRKGQDRKVEDLHDACAEALASVSAHMSWCSYLALLNRCFREMKKHTTEEKRKRLVNLVCSILDKFHFAKEGLYEQEVRACLEKTLFPKIQKLMDSESDSVALRSFVAAVKVLKLLPKEIMDSNLDSLAHKISKHLRNREDRTRNEARKVLADCLKELGLEAYLQLFLKKLVSLFRKGSEVHVLGYTVNSILSECLPNPTGWMLDHCLETLLYVVESDIFGDVDDEHREYSSRRKTKKETKRRKSLDTLRLIAENVTFRSHALKLLSLVTRQLKRPMTSNLKSKIGDMLKHIAFGIESNPSVDQGDLFCFIYHRVDDGINNRSCLGDQASSLPSIKKKKSRHVQETCGGKSCPHLITVFALNLLHNRLKKIQPSNTNKEVVSKLDPFVKLLVGCLSSKYEDVVSSSVSCFTALIRLPLPSLKSEAGDVKTQVLAIIAKSAVSSSSPLVQSGKKLLKALLGNENFTFSSGELIMLIQLPMFVDLESDPSVDSLNASLSLVKAIVKRKVPKLYDVADQVSKLMITHGDESVRKKCKELQLDLLVNYTLSKKRLDGHFNFLLKSLSYEHSTGREVVIKVLEDVIEKFSQPKLGKKSVLDQQSQILFVELTRRLATDDAKESLSKICGLMKLLLGRISNYNSFLELCLAWYKQEKTHAKAAQVLGFFIEVRKEAFSEHIHSILLEEAIPILESAVQLQNTVEEGSIPFWKEAYYSLVMIEKLLKQFPDLCFAKHLEDVWKGVFKLLLHPHEWLQIITCRLLNYYFKKLAESPRTLVDDSLLGKPSSLFMVAASLCFQLKVEMRPSRVNKNNDAIPEEDIVTQNIVFAVSGLHSRIGESDDEYWSSLDKDEQAEFLKAFVLFDSGKVRSTFLALTSGSERSQDDVRNVLIGSLLKRMGELALDMDLIHTRIVRIVLSVYKEFASNLNQGECRLYALRIMFPLYKVCQGFTGKVISPELKQLAEEVRDSIRDKSLGSQMFVQVYSEIQKSLEAKREKRKREEKLMAVVNPERNAKRKLKLASKNKANKKRRIMSSKMQRWSRS